VILSLKVIIKLQNTALNHVKEKHILNTQLKNVKSADKKNRVVLIPLFLSAQYTDLVTIIEFLER
jgi:hypothetical protein